MIETTIYLIRKGQSGSGDIVCAFEDEEMALKYIESDKDKDYIPILIVEIPFYRKEI